MGATKSPLPEKKLVSLRIGSDIIKCRIYTLKRKGIENQLINNRELSKLSVMLPEPSETHIKFGQGSLNGTLFKMSDYSEDKRAKT